MQKMGFVRFPALTCAKNAILITASLLAHKASLLSLAGAMFGTIKN